MSTAIASWGNSDAIRIPRDLLQRLGLKRGDRVRLEVNGRGNLEVVPESRAHRRVNNVPQVSFASAFAGYDGGRLDGSDAWPTDALVGAEKDAWSM